MQVKFNGLPGGDAPIVYVRAVKVADLPESIQEQAEGHETLYSVHRPNGERVALVVDRQMAFALALQNDLSPVNVH